MTLSLQHFSPKHLQFTISDNDAQEVPTEFSSGSTNILISISVQPVTVTNTATDLSYRLNAITVSQMALSPDMLFSIKTKTGIRSCEFQPVSSDSVDAILSSSAQKTN
jgi:hypothetical protein